MKNNHWADYHIHTSRCNHAEGEMDAYVHGAVAKGLHAIGFSDHAPAEDGFDSHHRMDWDQFRDYEDDVKQMRRRFPGLIIRLGIEVDLYPGFESDLDKLRQEYEIDYVIGSVHFIQGESIYFPDRAKFSSIDVDESVQSYFKQIQYGVQSGLIDVVGHLDLIKWAFPSATEVIRDIGVETLAVIRKEDKVLELNTSGLRKSHKEMYPDSSLLRAAGAHSVPVCFGSDAHRPEDVGAGFDEGISQLVQAGYRDESMPYGPLFVFRPAEDAPLLPLK